VILTSATLQMAQNGELNFVKVLLINHLLEAFAGSLARLDARHALAKGAAAVQTAALAYVQFQDAPPEAPVVMADPPAAPAFVPQMRPATVGARYRPGIPGRYRNRAAAAGDIANLVLGQP